MGFVEKQLGEVVGSQMAEQVLREGVFQLAVSPPILTSPSKHMGISAAGLKLLARGLYLQCKKMTLVASTAAGPNCSQTKPVPGPRPRCERLQLWSDEQACLQWSYLSTSSSSPAPVPVTSHLRRPYGPLAGLARKLDYRKYSGFMSATNQKTQLQDSAEGLRCDIAWGGRRTRSPPWRGSGTPWMTRPSLTRTPATCKTGMG